MKHIELKKYQFRDAYRTAPAGMGQFALIKRVLGTLGDSRYGKELFDTVIVGDDPIISLCLANYLARCGQRVLISPDSLGTGDWPDSDWGYQLARMTNEYTRPVAELLASQVTGLSADDSYMKALSMLIKQCARSSQISMLVGESLQSSVGKIKGCEDLIFFPLHRNQQHLPVLNPLWRLAKEKISQVLFNHDEIEFVQARSLYITTPTSKYIDPALGLKVGLAREDASEHGRISRADDLLSVFVQFGRDC